MVTSGGLLVTGEEHRKRNSLNELRFGCDEAIFMPSGDLPTCSASLQGRVRY